MRSATLKKPRNGGNFRDRMCNCITAHARLYDYHLVRAAPRHPRHRAKGRHFRIDAYCGGFCRNPVMSSTNTTPTAANTAVTAMVATSPRTTPSCRGCNVSPRCRTRWHTRGIWSSRAPVVAPASAAGFLPPVCVGLRTGAVRYTSR